MPFPSEGEAKADELQREMDRRWDASQLTRGGFLELAKELATTQGDGFAHSCILRGMGQDLDALDELFTWAKAQGIKPITMFVGLGPLSGTLLAASATLPGSERIALSVTLVE